MTRLVTNIVKFNFTILLMMKFKHKELAAGRWHTLSLAEQLGNIGSEVLRTSRAQNKADSTRSTSSGQAGSPQDEKLFWGAVERALELFDLTLADPRWLGRLREIGRAREVFCDAAYGGKLYKSSFENLMPYFDHFAFAARNKIK